MKIKQTIQTGLVIGTALIASIAYGQKNACWSQENLH